MNWMQVSASWREVKTRVQRKWRKLTDDDLELIDGRRDRLERKILQLYGFAPDHVRKEIDDWVRWQATRPRRSRSRSALATRHRVDRSETWRPQDRGQQSRFAAS